MGSVYQQKGVWRIQYYREGRQHIESSHSHHKDDAVRLLKLREGAIAKGVPVAPKIGRLRFDEAAQDLLDEYRLNNRDSLDELERRIRLHLEPFFGRRRMATIAPDDIVAFTKHRKAATIKLKPLRQGDPPRERPYSNAEINRELATLKRMFNLARKREKLQFVPHFEMLREDGARKGFFERTQVDAIAARLPEPLDRLLMFAYITGWRIPSEIFTLKTKSHVYMQDREIRLDPELAKNDDGRVFPFTAELEKLVKAQIAANERWQRKHGKICPWLFHRNGKKITRFEKAFKKACREVGLPGRIPHDFRRTAVRNLIKAGVSEKVAMLMTGHKTRSVFDRYNIVNEEDMRGAATKLDALRQRQLDAQNASIPRMGSRTSSRSHRARAR